MRTYAWRDVETVRTTCYRSSRHDETAFLLIMRDGTGIDLLAGLPTISGTLRPALPRLSRALSGVPFEFDTSGVAQSCSLEDAAALTRRP
jgi:hypothetical protein